MFQQKFELSEDTQRGDNRLLSLTTEVQASLSIEKTKQLWESQQKNRKKLIDPVRLVIRKARIFHLNQ
jgi:hypothetical protein